MHIHIVSPSGIIDPLFIDQAFVRLREWGYVVTIGAHARHTHGRLAGTDAQRAADIEQALRNPDIDIILCARGGYGLQRIIDQLPPIHKPIIGFSDITALHCAAALCMQPTLHGPMCKHIATLSEESEAILRLQQALRGEPIQYTLQSHPLNRLGSVTAPIIGGNLSVLYGLQATPFGLTNILSRYNTPPILLIEDICERHYHIDRMMHNLRLSGVLEQISGLIVGQFTDCENDPSMPYSTIQQTINEAVASYNYPVLFDAPFGHIDTNMPIWFNTPATMHIDTTGAQIDIPSPL